MKICTNIFFGVFFSVLFAVASASAMSSIMPLNEIKEGMQGYGKTVIDSTGEKVPFDVEIIGILNEGKKGAQRIIAKVSGEAIERAGGFLQGMSGSPIYIDGRLIGGGSATFRAMDDSTILITPIEEMLPIWEMPDNKNKTKLPIIDLKKVLKERQKKEIQAAIKKAQPKNDRERRESNAGMMAFLEEIGEFFGLKKEDFKKPQAVNHIYLRDFATFFKKVDFLETDFPKVGRKVEAKSEEVETPLEDEKPSKEEDKKPQQIAGTPPSEVLNPPPAAGIEKGPLEGIPEDTPAPEYKNVLSVSGFHGQSLRFLEEKLKPLGIDLKNNGTSTSSTSQVKYNAHLEEGSPVGAALMYGDFFIGASGTVTTVDKKRVLAFGHPFLFRGNVNYFMTEATVIGTVNGPTDGMKLMNTKSIIGRISQDRSAGIAGTIGEFPSVVPVKIRVTDKTLGRKEKFSAHLAYDEMFLPLLTPGVAYASLGEVVDTGGESTLKVHFSILSDALGGKKIERTNMFYAGTDVGMLAFGEISEIMGILASNKEKETDIYEVDIDVESLAERRTAVILSAVPTKEKVLPGETVNFKTTIKPYRKEKIVFDIPFTVPKNQPSGELSLDFHGGAMVQVAKIMALLTGTDKENEEEYPQPKTTKELVEEFLKQDANHEIIIEPSAKKPLMTEEEEQKAIEEAIKKAEKLEKKPLQDRLKEEKEEEIHQKFPTGYVIENVVNAKLTIEEDKQTSVPEE